MTLKGISLIRRQIENPLAKAEPIEVKKNEIVVREKAQKSIMPDGQLNKLRREDILDLLAYIYARGDKKHELFHEHHH